MCVCMTALTAVLSNCWNCFLNFPGKPFQNKPQKDKHHIHTPRVWVGGGLCGWCGGVWCVCVCCVVACVCVCVCVVCVCGCICVSMFPCIRAKPLPSRARDNDKT